MASLNKVFLMGNLTRDPELRYTPSGAAVCELGLAVNRKYMSNNQEQEEVCFVDVVVWGKQAESCGRYLEKGSPALVEGRLRLDQWQDKTSGANRSKLQVVAERVQFMPRGERREHGNGGSGQGGYNPPNNNGGGGGAPRQNNNNTPQSGQGYYKPPVQQQASGGTENAGATAPPPMPDGAFDVGKGAEDDIPF